MPKLFHSSFMLFVVFLLVSRW